MPFANFEPIIMWKPRTGEQVRVETVCSYDRYIDLGYEFLMFESEGVE